MTKAHELLIEAGLRRDDRGHWRSKIDGSGFPLTASEQEVNRRGGRDHGTDAREILSWLSEDTHHWLDQFRPDERNLPRDIEFWREWAQNAERELTT